MPRILKIVSTVLAIVIAIILAIISAFLLWTYSLTFSRFEDRKDPQLGALIEGIATSDALWIRGSTGQVVRINRTSGERTLLSKDTIDIMADGQHLWALSKTDEDLWQVADLRDVSRPAKPVSLDAPPIALFSTTAGPAILGQTSALLPAVSGWRTAPLSEKIYDYASTLSLSDNTLYVGYEHGEFGGGLRQINLTSGQVSIIEDTPDPRHTQQLCQGLLNAGCDPVVGLVSDPQQPDCILAGTSLSHLSMHDGVVVKVCGSSLTPVFSREIWTLHKFTSDPDTWPFNTLIPVQKGWIAVGSSRYARADYSTNSTKPKIKMSGIPRMDDLGGLQVSKEIDGVIFVEAICCLYYGLKKERWVIALPLVSSGNF